jgi:hypothetical protein
MQGAQRNTLVPRLRLREVLSLPLSSENSNHSKYQLRVGPFLAAAVRVMGVVVAVDHTNYIVTIDDSSAVVPIHGSSLESRSFIPYKIGQLLEVVGEVCHQESRAIVAHSIYIREDPMHEMSFQLEIISCSRECYFSEYFRPKPDTTKPPDDAGPADVENYIRARGSASLRDLQERFQGLRGLTDILGNLMLTGLLYEKGDQYFPL